MVNNITCIAWRVGIAILVIAGTYSELSAQPTKTCPDGQFLATYYKNQSLAGPAAVVRCEKDIDHDWGVRGPTGNVMRASTSAALASDTASEINDGKADGGSTVRSIGIDHFSVRWAGRFNFTGGDYTFVATADDGIRVWVDDELIIDQWRAQAVSVFRATRNLTAGLHRVKVEYFENDRDAVARLRW